MGGLKSTFLSHSSSFSFTLMHCWTISQLIYSINMAHTVNRNKSIFCKDFINKNHTKQYNVIHVCLLSAPLFLSFRMCLKAFCLLIQGDWAGQKFGHITLFNVFEISLLCSSSQHLFDQKYRIKSNIVKYYNLRYW